MDKTEVNMNVLNKVIAFKLLKILRTMALSKMVSMRILSVKVFNTERVLYRKIN